MTDSKQAKQAALPRRKLYRKVDVENVYVIDIEVPSELERRQKKAATAIQAIRLSKRKPKAKRK